MRPGDVKQGDVKVAKPSQRSKQSKLEVADIFRRYGGVYRAAHKLSSKQQAVMFDIEHCRSSYFGYHIDICDQCGHIDFGYNKTLLQFGQDPKWLGAMIGFYGILHTWGGKLWQHLHLHFIVSGGGLSGDGRWVQPKYRGKFIFPVMALSQAEEDGVTH